MSDSRTLLYTCHSEQSEEPPYFVRGAAEADSFAALRNDKRENLQLQTRIPFGNDKRRTGKDEMQPQTQIPFGDDKQRTSKDEMRGFFPLSSLRVRMTSGSGILSAQMDSQLSEQVHA